MTLLAPREIASLAVGRLPDTLAAAKQRDSLAALPDEPGPFFSFGCFEVRLDDDPRVDFLACALDADGGRRAARESLSTSAGPQADLLAAWAREDEPSLDTAGLWLEWDVQPDGTWVPFAFLRAAQRVEQGRWRRERLARWLDWGTPLLPGGGISCALRERVLATNESLPSSCKIHHLATLASRGQEGVRLHVGLPKRDFGALLESLAWSNPAPIRDTLEAWSVLPDPIGVQFEVSSDSVSWLDLEFYLNSTPLEDPRWTAFSDWAQKWVPLAPGKLEAAFAWGEACSLPDPELILLRRTSLKARIARDGRAAAKAYLGFSPRVIPKLGTKTWENLIASLTPAAARRAVAVSAASGVAASASSQASASASSRDSR